MALASERGRDGAVGDNAADELVPCTLSSVAVNMEAHS